MMVDGNLGFKLNLINYLFKKKIEEYYYFFVISDLRISQMNISYEYHKNN